MCHIYAFLPVPACQAGQARQGRTQQHQGGDRQLNLPQPPAAYTYTDKLQTKYRIS